MNWLYTIILGLVVVLSPMAFAQEAGEAGPQAKAQGELVEGKSKFKETWVRPGASLAAYDKIVLGGGRFEFRDVGPAEKYRSSARYNSKNEYGIAEEEREKFRQVVNEAFVDELSKSRKFDVVEEPGPNTIIVQGAVLDIVSHVPPEPVGRSTTYLNSVASVTLVLEILDSETGEVLAYVEERRKIEPPGSGNINRMSMPASSVTVWADIGRWAHNSAARLRSVLEKAQKKS